MRSIFIHSFIQCMEPLIRLYLAVHVSANPRLHSCFTRLGLLQGHPLHPAQRINPAQLCKSPALTGTFIVSACVRASPRCGVLSHSGEFCILERS